MAKKKSSDVQKEEINLLSVVNDIGAYKITPASEEEIKEKRKSPFFQIIESLFVNKGYINNLTEQQANQNLFMVLRRLSINYPIQANVFNIPCVNALDVLKFWSDYLYCGNKPKWIYLSTSDKTENKEKKEDISKKDIDEYIEFYGIERKEFEFALKLFHDEAVNEVIEFKNYIKRITSKNESENTDN